MSQIFSRLAAATKEGRLLSGLRRRLTFLDVWRELRLRRSLGLVDSPCDAIPCISRQGDFSSSQGALLAEALARALNGGGRLPDAIRAIDGMSGQRYRSFINELVALHPEPRYLEVGSWMGSTATAAIYGNRVKATCIDNWSLFGGPKAEFLANIEQARGEGTDFTFLEQDFRLVDYSAIGAFNIYLFDGPHEEDDQYDGVILARPALEKRFILIVDDWNWRQVRIGTLRAIADMGCKVSCAIEIRTSTDNTHARHAGRESDWHNGYFIAAIDCVL